MQSGIIFENSGYVAYAWVESVPLQKAQEDLHITVEQGTTVKISQVGKAVSAVWGGWCYPIVIDRVLELGNISLVPF